MPVGTFGSIIEDDALAAAGTRSVPVIAHCTGNVYAVTYHDSAPTGELATFTIDADGTINPTILDTVSFAGTGAAPTPNVIKLSDGFIAVTWADDTTAHIHVSTYSVTALGILALVATLEVNDDSTSVSPIIRHIAGNTYALLYNHGTGTNDLAVTTIGIQGDGTITGTIDFNNDLNTNVLGDPQGWDVGRVRSNIAVVVFADRTTEDGFIITFTIDDDGTVDETILDTVEHDGAHGQTPNLVVLDADNGIVVIAYVGTSLLAKDGMLQSFTIAADGTITQVENIDLGGTYQAPGIFGLGQQTFIFMQDNEGDLETYVSDSSGNLTLVDSITTGLTAGIEATFVHVSGSVMAFAFDDGTNTRVATVDVQNALAGGGAAVSAAVGMQQRELLLI